MTTRRSFLKNVAALGVAAAAPVGARASDSSRLALVIGNDAYGVARLRNAANDARAVGQALAASGFDVTSELDARGAAMTERIREFAAAVERSSARLALFYFAGHGVQLEWRNYLLPVDIRIAGAEDIRAQGIELTSIVSRLRRAENRSFLIILDACRNNPFRSDRAKVEQGLSAFDAPVGTLIAFSTSPGNVASDGPTEHGLYSDNLVRELAVAGLRVEDMFKRVRASVTLASKGAQIPWESTSLVEDVYIRPAPAPTREDLERAFEAEVAQWQRIKASRNPADWAALLRDFPSGRLAEIAQTRLNLLLAEGTVAEAMRPLATQPLRIELGELQPVPEFLARPANPHSAGTYPVLRRFNLGDVAIYDAIGRHQGRRRRRDDAPRQRQFFRVTRIDAENDRVEMNRGHYVTDLLGNPREITPSDGEAKVVYEVPFQIVPAELQVGRRWHARYSLKRHGEPMNEDVSFEIVARERVHVPAGEFDAFRIESRAYGHRESGRRPAAARREDLVRWEVPGLNFPVREERTIRSPSGFSREITLELVSLRQGRAR